MNLLLLGWGNPSRGDDALGPALLEVIAAQHRPAVTCLTDFQLQPEHALDLLQRDGVLFVDAAVNIAPPWRLSRLQPQADRSFSSHALSAQAVLAVYRQLHGSEPPPCYLLGIRGYDFELGEPMSSAATYNLRQACVLVERLLAWPVARWPEAVTTDSALA